MRLRYPAGLVLPLLLQILSCGPGEEADEVPGPIASADTGGGNAVKGYRCGSPIASEPAARRILQDGYADWVRRYVTRSGAGGLLRVRMPEAEDHSSSEGIGYGMLLAVYLDDRPTFDALWAYARRYHNANGLMAWDVDPKGRVVDGAAATDADEDMAFALLVADSRWGGYQSAAVALIGSLMRSGVEPGTHVFKPGDGWGGSAVTNPSYFAPAYYKAFAAATGDSSWHRVADTSYGILDRVVQKHSRTTGLQPDWVTAAGDSAPGSTGPADAGFEFHYGYGATRVPWRLAMDAAWNCDPRARSHLERLNAFFQRVGTKSIRDGYRLDGTRTGRWHSAAFVAPLAAAAMFAPDAAYARDMWEETVGLKHDEYYHDALRLLSLLLASGEMHPPAPPASGGSPAGG